MRVYPKRTLIVLHGSIGDVTRALPLASLIRKGFPDVKLSWAVEAPSFPWWSTIHRSMKSLSSIGNIGGAGFGRSSGRSGKGGSMSLLICSAI